MKLELLFGKPALLLVDWNETVEGPGMAKFGGNGNEDDDELGLGLFCGVTFLLSLIEKFNGGGGDIGTMFGRLMVNDGEMGSQRDVSISTASNRVVVPSVPRFTGARSRDNLLTASLDLLPLLSTPVQLFVVVLKWLLFGGATSATAVTVLPPPPPGSTSL